MKKVFSFLGIFIFILSLVGCSSPKETAKIGVSFGVGGATRWKTEKVFMEERATEIGAEIEVRLNTSEEEKPQKEDCIELIDSGIDVLIIMPRSNYINDMNDVLDYAKEKNVKVITYARTIMGHSIDLFVGYDCDKIGQSAGDYLVEKVYQGDYIILKGDKDDFNTPLLYDGAMKSLQPLIDNNDIRVILNEYVPGWSEEEAQKMVYDAIVENEGKVDAILAPNDAIASGCIKALEQLGITTPVAITGMDADINAVRRIIAGKQDLTVYMDLKLLAYTAIDEAYKMAMGQQIDVNTAFDNRSEKEIEAYLINGQLVTKENIDKILIDTGYYTKEEVYSVEVE